MRQKYHRRLWYSLPPPALFSKKNFDNNYFVEYRRVPLQRLSVLWDNKFSINKRDIHLLGTKTFDNRNFLKDRRIPLPSDSALWDKKVYKKLWYSFLTPPLFSINSFDARNVVRRRRVPLRSFSVLWDKKYSNESRDIPISVRKNFRCPNFLKHRRLPLRNDSVPCNKTILTKNRDASPPPPLSLTISQTRIFLKHRKFLLQNF